VKKYPLPGSAALELPRRVQVQESIQAGAILIKEGTRLPKSLRFESESCVPGWRIVKNLDGYGLDRKIREAGWNFFCQADETNATVFGIDKEKMARRAIERILAELKSGAFNSLAILRVASESSKRFLGVGYLTVSAQSRHIQQNLFLFKAKERQVGTGQSGLPPEPNEGAPGRGTEPYTNDRAARAKA
jgi:hypothetical protein